MLVIKLLIAASAMLCSAGEVPELEEVYRSGDDGSVLPSLEQLRHQYRDTEFEVEPRPDLTGLSGMWKRSGKGASRASAMHLIL